MLVFVPHKELESRDIPSTAECHVRCVLIDVCLSVSLSLGLSVCLSLCFSTL